MPADYMIDPGEWGLVFGNETLIRKPYFGHETLALSPWYAIKTHAERAAILCRWLRPTLEMVGIYGGFKEEGIKTIVPAKASLKLAARLVPGQDPTAVLAVRPTLRYKLRTRTPSPIWFPWHCFRTRPRTGSPGFRA